MVAGLDSVRRHLPKIRAKIRAPKSALRFGLEQRSARSRCLPGTISRQLALIHRGAIVIVSPLGHAGVTAFPKR
jgi:hypothetical protein